MADWMKKFVKPHDTVNCPSCGRAASFAHRYTEDSRGLTGVVAYCQKCKIEQEYTVTTDYRRAYEYSDYEARAVGIICEEEKNPGEGMSKTVRRLGNYTPDFSRTERLPGEDRLTWLRRVLS